MINPNLVTKEELIREIEGLRYERDLQAKLITRYREVLDKLSEREQAKTVQDNTNLMLLLSA